MTEQSYAFSINADKGNLDFLVTPVEGSVVKELSTITCTTDDSKPSSTYALSYSHNKEPWVYVKLLNEKGDSIARAEIDDYYEMEGTTPVVKGFTLNFEPAITEPGKYTIVMTDSVYCLGEGYEAGPNEYEVRFSYTVVEGPKAELNLMSITPADESTVESLETISLCTERTPIYCVPTPVTALNRAGRKTYTGTLTMDEESSYYVNIKFDEPITEEGDYTIDIPEGIFGDKEWYDSDYMAGTCNPAMTLYYTVGAAAPEGELFTTDPAAGSNVTSLNSITIYVGDGTKNYSAGSGKVTFTAPDGTTLFSGDPECILDDPDNWDEIMYRYGFALDDEATAEGTYTLTIPDGYFLDENGDEVAGTTITWTIGGSDTPDTKSVFTTDPEANSTVASLSKITINVGDGTQNYAENSGKVTITGPDGTVLFNNDPETIWPDDWDALVYQFEINLAEVAKTPGVYTMTIPDGYFVDENYDPVAGATITWTIADATGINGISADKNVNAKVYTIGGKALNSVKGLKGVYIVNGKKVILK